MKILDLKVNWWDGYGNDPTFQVLVDNLPNREDMRFEQKENCYFAELDGYVQFFFYDKPGDGYGGAIFNIVMKDGSTKELKGPWSSRSGVMNNLGFTPSLDVDICTNQKDWENNRVNYGGNITLSLLQEYLKNNPITDKWGKVIIIKCPMYNTDIQYNPAICKQDGEYWIKNPVDKWEIV